MRVLVTGAGGFLGGAVVRALSRRHDVLATDRHLPAGVRGVSGDLTDLDFTASLFDRPVDAVIHLATLPGGATERDPDLGWSVNVEATCTLARLAAAQASRPRFLFASSIAVFGETDPTRPIDDGTPPLPTLLYGAHKAICETWLATLTRRGALRALSLRLPAVVARPDDGAALISAFMSEVFHAVAARRAIALPVSPQATMWLLSAKQAAAGITHALALDEGALPASRALTLPALRLPMAELVAAIATHVGCAPQVSYAPDPAVERAFGSLPPLTTALAETLGFAHDGDAASLVRHVLEFAE